MIRTLFVNSPRRLLHWQTYCVQWNESKCWSPWPVDSKVTNSLSLIFHCHCCLWIGLGYAPALSLTPAAAKQFLKFSHHCTSQATLLCTKWQLLSVIGKVLTMPIDYWAHQDQKWLTVTLELPQEAGLPDHLTYKHWDAGTSVLTKTYMASRRVQQDLMTDNWPLPLQTFSVSQCSLGWTNKSCGFTMRAGKLAMRIEEIVPLRLLYTLHLLRKKMVSASHAVTGINLYMWQELKGTFHKIQL